MDVKQTALKLILFCLCMGSLRCTPTEEEVPFSDDANSIYSGQKCYGSAISNQFLVTYSDGSVQTLRLTKNEVLEQVKNSSGSGRKIKYIEQDRFFPDLRLDESQREVTPKPLGWDGIYWQVWGQEAVHADELWNQGIKGQGVLVGVIDGGIDINHSSLSPRIAINEREIPENGIDDDSNGLVDDYKGYDFAYLRGVSSPTTHGTHVAGIIAAEPNGGPMIGMAAAAQILPLNMMYERDGGTLSAAIYALKYAQSRGARIINASWGGVVCANTLGQTIEEIGRDNILFVTAAGNDGNNIDLYPEYPAAFAFENQITVGASVQSGLMAAFSNFGPLHVSILAPGHQILSSVPGGWQTASGTSMSAPFVSGLAALLWSAHPEATVSQIKGAILDSVVDPKDYFPVRSRGVIDAPRALEKLRERLSSNH